MSGNATNANSGYTGLLTDGSTFKGCEWLDDKYYDIYISNSVETGCGGSPCKGHAMNEVAGWYGDWAIMVSKSSPWSDRSGAFDHGTLTGVFYWNSYWGNANARNSFRIVLTPNS